MSLLFPHPGGIKALPSFLVTTLPTESCNKYGESTAATGHIRTNNRIIEVVFKEDLSFYHGAGRIKLNNWLQLVCYH